MQTFARALVIAALAAVATIAAADDTVLVNETGYLRCYYRFGVNRYSPQALRADGMKVLGKVGLDKWQRETERLLTKDGIDPKTVNWQEHLLQPLWENFRPVPAAAPPPPAKWADADFADSAWVRQRRPFQGSPPLGLTMANLGQFDEAAMDMGLLHAYYRAKFVLDDPAKAGELKLRLAYHGGVRVLVNGQEVAKANLKTDANGEPAGADYSADVYADANAKDRVRTLGPVAVPAAALRAGVNVLAIEVHASDFHPVVLNNPRQANWGGPTRPFPHGKLVSFELRATGQATSALTRPPGVQVWAEDIHHRVESTDFLPPGENPGVVAMVAPRGGLCSGQVVIGSDKALSDISLIITGVQTGAADGLYPDMVRVMMPLPYPRDEWTLKKLGDERGLDATFPDMKTLAGFEPMQPGRSYVFDALRSGAPKTLPADSARPVWLSVQIPENAAPGRYLGRVTVKAAGLVAPVSLPIGLEVIGWRVPKPADFQTFVACEENPYAVARQHNVQLWSDAHFKLIEASLAQLARIGNKWANVPVIANSEFGNKTDSMIRWTRGGDGQGSLTFDFAIMDRYLDLVEKTCGRPRVVQAVVELGMKGGLTPPPVAQVPIADAGGAVKLTDMDCTTGGPTVQAAWKAFAAALVAHMKARKQEAALFWGAPLEGEADPKLKEVLAQAAPGVFWTAGPHEMMSNGVFAKDEKYYRMINTIRYWGNWPSFRVDQGWKSKTPHLLNPRVGGTVFALHTTSHPFAYRVLADRAVAMGRSGFTRVGADDWAATHYSGMTLPKWLTGVPVLFVLWPAEGGALSSVRFEALIEGVQEAEARIAIEKALDAGGANDAGRKVLADNLAQTRFFLGNSIIHAFEQYHYGWQARSRAVYEAAAAAK